MAKRTVYLTVTEVMEYLRLGRTTVYAQANLYLDTDGAEGIPCRRFGRSLRFPLAELEAAETLPAEQRPVATAPSKTPRRLRPATPEQQSSTDGDDVEPTQLNLLESA